MVKLSNEETNIIDENIKNEDTYIYKGKPISMYLARELILHGGRFRPMNEEYMKYEYDKDNTIYFKRTGSIAQVSNSLSEKILGDERYYFPTIDEFVEKAMW